MASKKQGRRKPAGRHARTAEAQGGGVLARMADHAIENPAMSGGLFVMALTATAIFSNALFLQKAPHPEPIFATRSAAAPDRPPAVPLPRSRVAPSEQAPPLPRDAPSAAKPATLSQSAADTQKDTALVAAIQRALTDVGLYRGAIDGKFGAQTRTAIAAYERRQKLTVTGDPSPAILARIHQERAVTPQPAAAPEPAKTAPAAKAEPDPAAVAAARYRRVQTALNNIGYGPLTVDGQSEGETEDAIRRFELDNGLPLTGTADDAVIARLIKIGAMSSN